MEDTIVTRYDDVQTLDATLALPSDRRRFVVDHLSERECPVALEGLAEAVATREVDSGGVRPDSDELARALHHTHLPKLAASSVIDYDAEERTVVEMRRDLVVSARDALASTLHGWRRPHAVAAEPAVETPGPVVSRSKTL